MLNHHSNSTCPLGADLRALRKARGITLVQLAGDLGRSVGWLSQVERDISRLSRPELRAFAKALDVPVSILSGQRPAAGEQGYVVRAGARREITKNLPGLTETLLSPDLTDDFEVVHSVFEPGAKSAKPVQRETQEVAYLVSGRLRISIGDKMFDIHPGDSFRIRGEIQAWENPFDTPAVAIWVIAPPVY